jgi:MFS family permease
MSLLRDQPSGAVVAQPDTQLLRAQLRQRDYVLLALAGFGANWATWGFAFWVNALLIEAHKIPPARAGLIGTLFGVGAMIAQPLYGMLSDLTGRHRKSLLLLDLGAFVVMLMIFGTLRTETQLLAAAPVLGIAAFAYSPLLAAMMTEMVDRRIVASAVGICNGVWQMGSVIVPIAVGYTFQLSKSFEIAFATLACGPLLAMATLAWVRGPHRIASPVQSSPLP